MNDYDYDVDLRVWCCRVNIYGLISYLVCGYMVDRRGRISMGVRIEWKLFDYFSFLWKLVMILIWLKL